jgi:predicted enzyme related to lactoylglutathione lyase
MAKVMGLGGVFFLSKDPKALAAWYAKWLKLDLHPAFDGAVFMPNALPEHGYSVWALFEEGSDYMKPTDGRFMVNFMVDDVAEALAQVAEGGATVVDEPQDTDYGIFGWFVDPDGNKVELWKPKKAADTE